MKLDLVLLCQPILAALMGNRPTNAAEQHELKTQHTATTQALSA